MANENCLEGVKCPKCGQEDRFFIASNCLMEVTDEGAEAVGDTEWDETSYCRCADCEHQGVLKDFRTE